MEERLSMTERELDRHYFLQQVVDGRLTQAAEGKLLCLSDRQIRRLQQRLEQEGPAGLIHRLGCQTSRRLPAPSSQPSWRASRKAMGTSGRPFYQETMKAPAL